MICFINAAVLFQVAPPGKPLNGNRKAVAMKANENRAVKKPDSSKAKSTSSVEPIQLPPSFKGAFKFGKVRPALYIPLRVSSAESRLDDNCIRPGTIRLHSFQQTFPTLIILVTVSD